MAAWHKHLMAGAAGVMFASAPAMAQFAPIEPVYSIWDVQFGQPVTQIPEMEVVQIACGTNGGPPSMPLRRFEDYASCPPEPSGLREIHFANDDEADYIARAMEVEYKVLQGGTSIYAHPVIVSVLVDDAGIVRGIRIVTDDRASDRERRVAVTLARNLKSRFGSWKQTCRDMPPGPGEMAVGTQFIHELCTAENPELNQRLRIEATYLRKRGQQALDLETRQVNKGYFQSSTRLEVVEAPYEPAEASAL